MVTLPTYPDIQFVNFGVFYSYYYSAYIITLIVCDILILTLITKSGMLFLVYCVLLLIAYNAWHMLMRPNVNNGGLSFGPKNIDLCKYAAEVNLY